MRARWRWRQEPGRKGVRLMEELGIVEEELEYLTEVPLKLEVQEGLEGVTARIAPMGLVGRVADWTSRVFS